MIVLTVSGTRLLIKSKFKLKWDKEKLTKEAKEMKARKEASRIRLEIIEITKAKMLQAVVVVSIMNIKPQLMVLRLSLGQPLQADRSIISHHSY